MGLTENTATALLALNGLGVRPNSAVSVERAWKPAWCGKTRRLPSLPPRDLG